MNRLVLQQQTGLFPTASPAPRVERSERTKESESADSAARPARSADEPSDFARTLRDKRKDAAESDRSDSASASGKAERPAPEAKPTAGADKPKAGSEKPKENRKPEKAEPAHSDSHPVDRAAPTPVVNQKPTETRPAAAEGSTSAQHVAQTPAEVGVAPRPSVPADQATSTKGDSRNTNSAVAASGSAPRATEPNAASPRAEGAALSQDGLPAQSLQASQAARQSDTAPRAEDPVVTAGQVSPKPDAKQNGVPAAKAQISAPARVSSEAAPPKVVAAKEQDAPLQKEPVQSGQSRIAQGDAKAPKPAASRTAEVPAASKARSGGKAREQGNAAQETNSDADGDGQPQAVDAAAVSIPPDAVAIIQANTSDPQASSPPAGAGDPALINVGTAPLASATNGSTGRGPGENPERQDVDAPKIGPAIERVDSTTPSAGSAREMDLLGRLVAEPTRAPAAEGAATQADAGGTSEFARAMQAQVERGIERAAYQAAASGVWAGSEMGTGAVTIRLNPANLGMLRVHLRMDTASGGGVRAKFEASSARSRGILAGSIDSLRSALEDRGLKVDEVTVGELAQLPERALGLPPVQGREDHPADLARDSGAGFAGSVQQGASGRDALTGGAGLGSSAETGGVHAGGSAAFGFGEQSVTLPGSSVSPLTIGQDGRIRVDALV